jgi:flagellar hook assembly protein FlgD
MAPKATALLPNYPNPFNPETWIPFDIAQDAEVTVRIYNFRGDVVRRLELGTLTAGAYRSRGDAVYWDGRNDSGEQAASGVYIVELRTGTERHARRMVLRK